MKAKLSIDAQIDDLKYKNVKFEIINEEYAKKFLQNNNYYFKLKSYLFVKLLSIWKIVGINLSKKND
jgi:hypothetical protein